MREHETIPDVDALHAIVELELCSLVRSFECTLAVGSGTHAFGLDVCFGLVQLAWQPSF